VWSLDFLDDSSLPHLHEGREEKRHNSRDENLFADFVNEKVEPLKFLFQHYRHHHKGQWWVVFDFGRWSWYQQHQTSYWVATFSFLDVSKMARKMEMRMMMSKKLWFYSSRHQWGDISVDQCSLVEELQTEMKLRQGRPSSSTSLLLDSLLVLSPLEEEEEEEHELEKVDDEQH
jgi:hypothetical protein